MRKTTIPSPRDLDFVDWLQSLVKTERRGDLAALRHGLMYEEEQLFQLLAYIPQRFLQSMKTLQEEKDYLLVAGLFASSLMCFTAEELEKQRFNLGDSLRKLAEKRHLNSGNTDSDDLLSDPLRRRLDAVLACPRDELHEHLRQIVSLLTGEAVPVDWAQLLCDLRAWTWPGRPVQWDWSRAFYVGEKGGEE